MRRKTNQVEEAEFQRIAADALGRIGPKPSPRVRGKALPNPRWFIIHTGAGQESLAARKLHGAGYLTFYAFDRVRRRRKRLGDNRYTVEWIEKPYFSRYIFACLRFENDSIQAMEECDGVSVVVRKPLSGVPMEIQRAKLDKIMAAGMVRFDEATEVEKSGYRALMREIVLDVEKQVTLEAVKGGGRRMKFYPTSTVIA